MRRFVWPLLFLIFASAAPAGPAAPSRSDDATAACRTVRGEAVAATCSSAIASGSLKGRELAIVYNRHGLALDHRGDLEGALAGYNEALRADPNFAVALYNRGLTYRKKRDLDHALADFSEAIKLKPGYALAYGARGSTFIDKGDFDAATANLSLAIGLDPSLAIARAARGLAYRNKNDFDRALADFDEAIRLDPNFAAAYRERGVTYVRKNEFDLAIASYEAAIKLAPNVASSYIDRGRAYALKGDYALAIADAERALALNAGSGRAYELRGFAHIQAGDLDGARVDLDEAIRTSPDLASAYVNRGDLYHRKGDFDRSLADLDEAIRLEPVLGSAYAIRGLVHEAKGNPALARSDFAAALSHASDRTIAARGIFDTVRTRLAALAAATPPIAEKPAPAPPPQPAALMPKAAPTVSDLPANASASAITGERRVALVIGNSAYRNAPQLANALRDAGTVAAALRNLGFATVTLDGDLTQEQFIAALRDFSRIADTADWAVIYYAGHGIEMGGINYLIPTDATLETDRDVQFEAVPLDHVLSAVEGARKLRLVLLDACRENPFARRMQRTVASRSIGRGLARVEPEGGTLVAYAAKHGEIALDGAGANSPFVSALIKYIATPGIEISKLFRLVRDDVLAATGKRQEPFVYGSLPGTDFYFVAPPN
jgi:tetratricopeptide (TPR) repeat protein